jgi:pimeloyl-ACP methyl ester carboxylesterase
MNAPAPSVIFLAGFDGDAGLRATFIREMGKHFETRGIAYPTQPLGSLNGYCRYASGRVGPEERLILVGESFSGLVAARWAARDPHVEAIVLAGGFARNPMAWAASLGAALPGVVRFGAQFLAPMRFAMKDPLRKQWSQDLARTLNQLDAEVIGERLRIIAQEDVSEDLRALRIPVILLQFDGDLVVGPRARNELEALCHNARVIRHPGPHFALETQARSCADALGEALKQFAATEARRT